MGMASCGGVSLPRLSLDCSCPPAHEMLAPLARWHGPGGPPGRGAATGPRAPRPDGETAGGRAPRCGRPTAPPTPTAALPGALSLGGAPALSPVAARSISSRARTNIRGCPQRWPPCTDEPPSVF